MACATIAHSMAESSFCASVLAQKTFDLARSGSLDVPGFPNFSQAITELKSVQRPPQPDYSVCIPLGEALVINEASIQQWMDKQDYQTEMKKLVTDHNNEFNKRGIKRGSEAVEATSNNRPMKKLCISVDPIPLDEFETKHEARRVAWETVSAKLTHKNHT